MCSNGEESQKQCLPAAKHDEDTQKERFPSLRQNLRRVVQLKQVEFMLLVVWRLLDYCLITTANVQFLIKITSAFIGGSILNMVGLELINL